MLEHPTLSTQWEHPALSLERAIGFVHACLPDAKVVQGPKSVFADYRQAPDLRFTVQFATDDPSAPNVVLKVNRFPLLSGSGKAHRLVSQCAPALTPELLGCEEGVDGVLLLHRFFQGRPVSDTKDIAYFRESAQTLAHIQQAVTNAIGDGYGLELTETETFPAIFANIINVIRAHYADAWEPDTGGQISVAMGFPGIEVLDRLEAIESEVYEWSLALGASAISLSLDHGDCHTGNAVALPEGGVLIFDWENASVAHPYLSVEKLMTSACRLDAGIEGGPWGYVRRTPTQDLVRDEYLQAYNSQSDLEAKAFDAAMCLATVKEMRHEMEWARLCGWKHQNPEWTAQLVHRMFEHRARYLASWG